MSDWAVLGGQQRTETLGADTSTSAGTTITAAGSANAKGSWVQMVASTETDASAVWLMVTSLGNGNTDYLLDLGVGAAGAETVLVSNLQICRGSNATQPGELTVRLPVPIPAGTRVALRIQATTAAGTLVAILILEGAGWSASSPLGSIVTYGDATADSGGTSIDPGAVANTKGTWVQLTGSSTEAIRLLGFAFGNQTNSVRSFASWLVDLGIGAAGAEVVLIANLLLAADTASDLMQPRWIGPMTCAIPAGSRIAIRAQCSITDATDRLFDAILYGAA